ncbi:MAG: hypothetical protein WCK15_20935, partial [Pirellula sp.]
RGYRPTANWVEKQLRMRLETYSTSVINRSIDQTILIKVRELFSGLGEHFQEWCGRPCWTTLLFELADSFVDAIESHSIGIPHRPASMGWESVTVG